MVRVSGEMLMAMESYHNQAEILVRNYLLADPFIPYASILGGIFACKMLYDLTQMMSNSYFKSYANLTKLQHIEWNNRGLSTIHAIFITSMSLYFVFWSDLFSDRHNENITFRSSPLSTFALGVIHHSLSGTAVAYSMFTEEGQLYVYMVLISEITTPGINMRWFLDTAGLKKSSAYLINGVVIFIAWLVARILLFPYLFHHVYLHYNQVRQMHIFGFLLVCLVPSALAVMNLIWFSKIVKGLTKTIAEKRGKMFV